MRDAAVSFMASEQLLFQLTDAISNHVPHIDLSKIRIAFSKVISKYTVQKIEENITSSDLEEKISLYLATKKLDGLSPVTIKTYRIELRVFSQHISKKVSDISTVDIRAYLSKFPYLKNSSLGTKISILKSFFGWLASEDVIVKNPMTKIKTPKEGKRLPQALSYEELEITRESCKTLRQRALVELAYASGCRVSELMNLNRKDINWNEMTIRVIGKGDKERIVPISFRAIFHLKKYLKSRDDIIPAIFITEKRPYRRLSKRGIQREIAKIGKNAGFSKNLHPHVFRHTLATMLLNNGAELAFVQALLGHTDPKTTQRYANISTVHIIEQYRKCHTQ